MNLRGARVLLTGAAGGIGSATGDELARKGAKLVLLARSAEVLAPHVDRLRVDGGIVHGIGVDLLDGAAREEAVSQACELLGGVDVLVNCAGASSFRCFAEESPQALERLVQVNLVSPMLLARQLLPHMLARGSGRIVNVGSTFGSIGFAWFAAYSASKFGLRGFSEALRRELDGTGVGVTYVAPRAVKTGFNSGAVYRMAQATGMHMDEPQWVAARVVAAIESDAKDVYLGMPERFFARLNGFLPRLVDSGLRKQNRIMESFARGG